MKTIVKIKFGSHLYGTDTPNSDLDYKSVFIPDKKDILLQKAPKSIVVAKRHKKEGEKNLPGECDEEAYSLHYYIKLLLEGQTVALDMLFAPYDDRFCCFDSCGLIIQTPPVWARILDYHSKFISKKSAAFVGYCKQQANKYGIKGSRVSTVRHVLEILNNLKDSDTLETFPWPLIMLGIEHDFRVMEHCDFGHRIQPDGKPLRFLTVCGKSFPVTAKVKLARECLQKVMDNYGQRALMAEKNEGVDWKALSHAVRVANQAIELFQTGQITFPLVNREHILDIKLGKLPYRQVAEEIEQLLEQVNESSAISSLPEQPDHKFAEEFVAYWYGLECA